MRKPRRPTSTEVARRAGVSRSTVSFVLNDVTDISISPATRERVLDAARDLGYVPSAAARTLASGVSRTIGLVIGHAEHIRVDAFIPQALYSLNEICREQGYRVLVEAVEDVSDPEAYRELVLAKQIDGLVVLNPRSDDNRLPEFISEGFPVAVIGRVDHPNARWVDIDNVGAAREATDHLAGQGRRRIAHIAYGPALYESVRARVSGYRNALAEHGLDFDPDMLEYANFSADSGLEAMRRILDRAQPDALFCGNDMVAFGALRALADAGLNVPGDVAVVGFDDVPIAAFANPALSTIRMPAAEMGRWAGRLLLDKIQGLEPAKPHICLEAELVVRESSCPKP